MCTCGLLYWTRALPANVGAEIYEHPLDNCIDGAPIFCNVSFDCPHEYFCLQIILFY